MRERYRKLLYVLPFLLVAAAVAAIVLTKPARVMKQAREIAESGDYMAAVALLDELDRADKTAIDRQKYIDDMEAEIQAAIEQEDMAGALVLIDKYSVLGTSQKNIALVQSKCNHHLEETEYVANTCVAAGYRLEACTVCGYVSQSDIPASGHSIDSTVVKEPTCTEIGIIENVCVVCGEREEDTVTEALGHTCEKSIVTAAKCEKEGEAKYTCTRCGYSYTEEIPATGHSSSKATCTKAAVCSVCGKQTGSALGHTGSVGICSRCGYNTTPTITVSGAYEGGKKLDLQSHFFGYELPAGEYALTVETRLSDWMIVAPGVMNTSDGGRDYNGIYHGSGNASTKFTVKEYHDLRNMISFSNWGGEMGSYTLTIRPIN